MAGLDSYTKLLLHLDESAQKTLLHFDGTDASTTITDSTGNHSWTCSGNSELDTAQKKFGTASLYMPTPTTSAGGVTAADSTDWDIFGATSGSHTISLFVYFPSAANNTGGHRFLGQYEDGNNYFHLYVNNTATTNNIEVSAIVGGSTIISVTATGYAYDEWHHIALVRVGSEIGFYINGVQKGYDGSWSTGTISGLMGVGNRGTSDATGSDRMIGWIDDFVLTNDNFFNAAPDAGLTDTIIVPTAAIASSGGFIDLSTTAHTVSPQGDAAISATQSKFGGASGYLDGTGDYLTVADSTEHDLGVSNTPFEIDCWVRADSTTGTQVILSRGSGATNDWNMTDGNMYLFQLESGVPTFYYNNNGSSVSVTGPTLSATTWAHLAVTYDGTTTYVSTDGTQGTGVTTGAYYKPSGTDTTHIGRNSSSGSDYFAGYIDEVRISNGKDRVTDDLRDPFYDYTVPTAAYDDVYMTYSAFPARSEYVMWPSASFVARANAEEPLRMFASFTTRAITKVLREGSFPARIETALFRSTKFPARLNAKVYVETLFPTRQMAMYAPGWNIYITDMSTGITSFEGFIDGEGSPVLTDVALADGDYEIEARPILNMWEDTTGGIRIPVSIDSTGPSPVVVVAPTIVGLAGTYSSTGWTRLTWSVTGQPQGTNPTFGIWRGTTPVDTSGDPETTVLYDEQVQAYRALVRQTATEYFAVKYYDSLYEGVQSEVQVVVPTVSTLTTPTGVFAQ